jgi:hypothetical protein
VFFLFSFIGSFYFGLAAGLFFYVFVVIINTVIFGQRRGIIALIAAFSGLMNAAIAHSSEVITIHTNLNAYTASFNAWIIISWLFCWY